MMIPGLVEVVTDMRQIRQCTSADAERRGMGQSNLPPPPRTASADIGTYRGRPRMLPRLPQVIRTQRWGSLDGKYHDEFNQDDATRAAQRAELPEWERKANQLRTRVGRRGSEDPPDLCTLRLAEHVKSIMFFQSCGKVLASHTGKQSKAVVKQSKMRKVKEQPRASSPKEKVKLKEAWPPSRRRRSLDIQVENKEIVEEKILERHKRLALAIEDEMERTEPKAVIKTIELRKALNVK